MRLLRLLMAATILVAAPGLAPYRALAATFSAAAGKGNVSPVSRISLGGPGSSVGAASLGMPSGLKTLGLTTSLLVPAGQGPVIHRSNGPAEGVSVAIPLAGPSQTTPILTFPSSPLEILPAAGTPAAGVSGREGRGKPILTPVSEALGSKNPSAEIRRLYTGERKHGFTAAAVLDSGERTLNPAGKLKQTDSSGGKRTFTIEDLPEPSFDYHRMFDLTRRILARPAARKFIKEVFSDKLEVSEEVQKEHGLPGRIKEISESQLMLILQYNEPHFDLLEEYLSEMLAVEETDVKDGDYRELKKKWRKTFRDLLRNQGIIDAFIQLNDPLKPMHLRTEDGSPGYKNVAMYSSHESLRDGKTIPADDLKQVIIDFIEGAEESILFNVYEFSLMDIAEALLRKADAGVKITGGIDMDEIHHRPEIKAVYERLAAHKNITLMEVDSPGLNHQKMMVRDWKNKEKAKALFSSGNWTQSGIGPEGDLAGVPKKDRPAYSIPNANHIITLDSYLAAQVTANNLLKTLDYGMRGREYPLGGAFKIFGEKPAGAEEEPFLVLTFSPKGGLGKLNRDAIKRILHISRGPVRMLQFVFSSKSVYEALLERAALEIEENGTFDFKSVGDTPFALRPWSAFLALSGLVFDEKAKLKLYKKARAHPLAKLLGKAKFAEFIKNIRIAPPEYGTNYFKREGEKTIRVSGILHHKVLVSGDFMLSGSFNFTDNAESNNEHMIIFKDARMAGRMTEIHDGLFSRTDTSVAEEAEARNLHERAKAAKAKKTGKKTRRKTDHHNTRGRVTEAGEKEGSGKKAKRSKRKTKKKPAADEKEAAEPETEPEVSAKKTEPSKTFSAVTFLTAASPAAVLLAGSQSGLGFLAAVPSWALTSIEVAGILGATFLVSRLVRWGAKKVFSHTDWKELLESWLSRTAVRVVWGVGIAVVLGHVGVSLSSIMASAGIAGIALGFAVKDIAANLFAGLKLWWSVLFQGRPFRIGDRVEADGVEGRVTSVNTRFTTLDLSENESSDYERVLIPNQSLLNKIIKNKSGKFLGAAVLGGWMVEATPWMIGAAKTAGVLAGSWALSRVFRFLARRALSSRLKDRTAKLEWLVDMAGYSAYLVGGFVLLSVMGLSLSWLVTSVGVSAAVLALASKDIANNAVSGLMLAVYRPFGFGDTIKTAKVEGRVVDITHDFVTLELEGGSEYRFAHIPLSKLLKEKIYIGKKPSPEPVKKP